MPDIFTDLSQRKAALVAGSGLLAMTIFAIIAYYLILPGIIIPGNAAETAKNIMANEGLFRISIFCFIVVAILDVLVAWAFYVFLRPVNRSISLLMAWFRLVYASVLVFCLVFLVIALLLLEENFYLTAFGTEQLYAQMMLFIDAFNEGWAVGFIFFGLHLVLLGYLIFRSDYIPKILGILVMLAGLSYLIDYLGRVLLPDLGLEVSTLFGWGELLFMLWLLLKWYKLPEIKDQYEN
ncbi:DUF4386 domain-containing protein [Methanolobus sp. WCC4]|uniref:DUF4386 domain-containing protein n=1 Tax=Methanolobus sp. WCC4 TaxID=3125784 RepID=UPI0030FC8264